VEVAEEVNAGAAHALLNKLALLLGLPECCHKWSFSIRSVVFSHHFTYRYGSLASVIEGYCANEVITNVSANNIMEKVLVGETNISIDDGAGASHKCPCVISVMR
jgi:hypothetical protein